MVQLKLRVKGRARQRGGSGEKTLQGGTGKIGGGHRPLSLRARRDVSTIDRRHAEGGLVRGPAPGPESGTPFRRQPPGPIAGHGAAGDEAVEMEVLDERLLQVCRIATTPSSPPWCFGSAAICRNGRSCLSDRESAAYRRNAVRSV